MAHYYGPLFPAADYCSPLFLKPDYYSPKMVKLSQMCCGGSGCFNTKLTGPGLIIVASMSGDRMKAAYVLPRPNPEPRSARPSNRIEDSSDRTEASSDRMEGYSHRIQGYLTHKKLPPRV